MVDESLCSTLLSTESCLAAAESETGGSRVELVLAVMVGVALGVSALLRLLPLLLGRVEIGQLLLAAGLLLSAAVEVTSPVERESLKTEEEASPRQELMGTARLMELQIESCNKRRKLA